MSALRECLQKRFAEFTSAETFAEEVEITSADYYMNEYFDGSKSMDGEVARFMSVDRQINRYYLRIRGHRDDGSSRLLWATQAETIEQVREVHPVVSLECRVVLLAP